MKLFVNDADGQTHPRLVPFEPLVTMRGGSISLCRLWRRRWGVLEGWG
jgi:hypothetical protein